MSHPQPPQRQPTPDETQRYVNVLRNTALFAIIACPALALLPPRKFDVYTFGLGATTLFSANYLLQERTGRSVWQHITGRQRQAVLHEPVQSNIISATEEANLKRELQYADQEMRRLRDEKDRGSIAEQVSSQREAWKLQREKEIKDDVEEGKGFGEMITDQIWEVWNWGKTKDEEDD